MGQTIEQAAQIGCIKGFHDECRGVSSAFSTRRA
jgi:hypothetical protein